MPILKSIPKTLKVYVFHGVNIDAPDDPTKEEVAGDCPFCLKDRKFYVNLKTGTAHCKTCTDPKTNKGGWHYKEFLRHLWELSFDRTSHTDYDELARERKLLFPETLMEWGVCRSYLDGTWLVPGYDRDKRLCQLYRYVLIKGKRRLLASPELKHGLVGMNLWDGKRKCADVLEGVWDAMAYWEVMRSAREIDDQSNKYVQTGNPLSSLAATTNILAVPGAGALDESWLSIFSGKTVSILYDNDYPREVQGRTELGSGYTMMRRACKELAAQSTNQPESIHYLHWGNADDTYASDLPNGYDIRDHLSSGKGGVTQRIERLQEIVAKIRPMPQEWITEAKSAPKSGLQPIECKDWKTVESALRACLRLEGDQGKGMIRAFATMLACSISTLGIDDQIWIRVMGPAGCGKSTLCEAMAIAEKYVKCVDDLTGIFSGLVSKDGKSYDLWSQCAGKTLIVKDIGPLLENPNRAKILNELRVGFDRNTRIHFKNKSSRDYVGQSTTVIFCGTMAAMGIDSSELGERFLSSIIIRDIDDDSEVAVQRAIGDRVRRNRLIISNCKPESQSDPKLTYFKQVTAGYLIWLRENYEQLVSQIVEDDARHDWREEVYPYARFVAFCRARPSKKQDEVQERELSTRVTSQMVRLADCLALVLNKTRIDAEVIGYLKQLALDTAEGQVLKMVKYVYSHMQHYRNETDAAGYSDCGIEASALAHALDMHTKVQEVKFDVLIRFLKSIKVLEWYHPFVMQGHRSPTAKWRLTGKMVRLYEQVMR